TYAIQKWYERVTKLFLDEKHTVLYVDILGTTDAQAELALTVRWQACRGNLPAAESKRVDLESAQKWTVRRCSTTWFLTKMEGEQQLASLMPTMGKGLYLIDGQLSPDNREVTSIL